VSARSRRSIALLAATFGGLAVLAGCEDDLPKATEIVHMRVLGATLQVVGDETRATPKPGEKVRVSLSTVFPALERDDNGNLVSLQTKQRRVRALIVGCTAPTRYTGGIPICQELIDIATGVIETPPDLPVIGDETFPCPSGTVSMQFGPLSVNCTEGMPVLELLVPADYRRDRLLFSGVVCEQGVPFAKPDAQEPFGCMTEGVEAIRVHGLIPVQQTAAEENHNPDLSGFRITREIDGAWNPIDPSLLVAENETACKVVSDGLEDRAGLPLLFGHIDLNLIYDGRKRERFEGEPEPLEISLYTTHGEMERRFTVFEPDEPTGKNGELRSTLRYTPPKKDIPGGGQLARFFATLRDQRGGFAIAEFGMCLGQLVLPDRDDP
jgi:hypothetical protein